jgi:hypothetical protein
MRLNNIQFRFLPDGDGLKVCKHDRTQALARIVPDKVHANMWRIVRANGQLSDMLNKTRAKDVAWGIAETKVFLGEDSRAA